MRFKQFVEGVEVWLDDLRDPNDPQHQQEKGARPGMIWVKTYQQAIDRLMVGDVDLIAFDNDLGPDSVDERGRVREGRHVADWIEFMARQGELKPPSEWIIQTDNIPTKWAIDTAMRKAQEYWRQHEEEI